MLVLSLGSLFASLTDKSAILYYGRDISYPLVGIHDYIIVQPKNINTYRHGFDLYKKNIYAYVSIGELDQNTTLHDDIDASWIRACNKAWNSDVLDITDKEYRKFIFSRQIEPQIKRGFQNFFFDTLDSYHFYAKTPEEIQKAKKALADFIKEFHKRYPKAKLVINRGFDIIDDVHDSISAVLFESYYQGLDGNLSYQKVSDENRKWLDAKLEKVKNYNLDIIAVDYATDETKAKQTAQKLRAKGFIPYVADKHLLSYGMSSKNALKREILTLVYAPKIDIIATEAHEYGAMPLEYLGYIQRLYRLEKGFPDPKTLSRYRGVVIWLRDFYPYPKKLLQWIEHVKKRGIKIAFIGNFGFHAIGDSLKSLGIHIRQNEKMLKRSIIVEDPIVGYEIMPSMEFNPDIIECKECRPLLRYLYPNGLTHTPAAITSWGGYIVNEGYMAQIDGENLWVTNPFGFFKEALRLKKIPVADPTTENGKRLMFTHIDGDGIMNRIEGKFGKYSGDAILNHILKKYPIPHSVSIIGAEVDPHGLYPKISPELIKIVKAMFALPNVEPASHTYTHPFFWGKIKNGDLDPKYRLNPPGYKFSLKRELQTTLENINTKYIKPDKQPKARTIYWSGDCAPRENALEFIYKHHILAINGGDTTIQNSAPWLSRIAPFGLRRGAYYQVYAGAQNENVFTNDWLGPFWGYKRVVQTFTLTNSPRRLKPIDIYYHHYSGSKQASLEALKYVFDWAIKQDTMPLFASEYIPKVMDMYQVSVAHEADKWLFAGLHDLKTVRFEDYNGSFDLNASNNIAGFSRFEKHTYVSTGPKEKLLLKMAPSQTVQTQPYMLESNGKLVKFKEKDKTKEYRFKAHVPLHISFYLPKECRITIQPNPSKKKTKRHKAEFLFKKAKEATVTTRCP